MNKNEFNGSNMYDEASRSLADDRKSRLKEQYGDLIGTILLIVLGVLGILFSMVGVMLLGALSQGFVLSVLWGWFIVPVFNIVPLTYLGGFGIMYVCRFIIDNTTKQQMRDVIKEMIQPAVLLEKPKKSTGKAVIDTLEYIWNHVIVVPAVVLAFGWVIHSFM